ncbi:bifunctional diguanylate cyclase/phosphodiesterase [Azospirillum rugosum]|uniref:Diguanylate cyclase (GGDEF)-like protein n=1 Tax=Azospirillum rugosum TaxID=416170 RepID=A0ABS4SR80_9PROT|nr:EAL domain-containing protein [Azospirillum rugosum]MBP2295071.1 diguanylate cyclase (GGDEF)-like protein [Azospirillum rugosum]MDQ0528894.1 diguanylate cyclase (GGDEF)-like protein [Azospirillum rugosum]
MTFFQNRSLKLKLTLGATLLGGLLLLAQSVLQFYSLRSEVLERIEIQQFDLLSELSARLDNEFAQRLLALAQAGTVVPRSMLSDPAALERHLREETALLSLVDDLYIFDANGRLLVDWPEKPGRRGLDMSSRDYIQQVRATLRPTISRPILGKATRQPIIVLAAPVLDADGRLFGIIGGVLNLHKPNLLGLLSDRRVGQSGYYYLVTEDRTTVIHPDKSRIMQPIASPGVNPQLDRALEGFEGTGEGVNSRGLKGLFTFKRLETTRWILASVIPAEEAFSPIRTIQQRMIVTTVLLILVVTPLLWGSAQRLLKPLEDLAEAMRERAARMRRREPTTAVDKGGSSEIRTVASAFNEFLEARNQAEQALQRLAHHDALTGLPNRILLADRMEQALIHAKRTGRTVAVGYLDLDGFKPINDRFGHHIGDILLQELAKRMSDVIRADDTLARLGGDEFVVLLPGLDGLEQCHICLNRLLAVIRQPISIPELAEPLTVTASIGVTLYPLDGADPDTLLRHADHAMYQAKSAGRNGYRLYDPDEDLNQAAGQANRDRIRAALRSGQFELHYQPKVNMRQGTVVGAEALIRWNHPDQGFLPPGEFLPLIESANLDVEVGEWVIRVALAQIAAWQAEGHAIPVSVNIAASHLLQPDFPTRLAAMLAEHPSVSPRMLQIEVVETAALEDITHAKRTLDACRRLGVSGALDDFGTGYSSLTYLRHLPVDTLKIDQSFIRHLEDDADDLTIVKSIIVLAQGLGRTVVAEGVEKVEHGTILMALHCDLAQGYAIARPMPASAFLPWVRGWTPDTAWCMATTVAR